MTAQVQPRIGHQFDPWRWWVTSPPRIDRGTGGGRRRLRPDQSARCLAPEAPVPGCSNRGARTKTARLQAAGVGLTGAPGPSTRCQPHGQLEKGTIEMGIEKELRQVGIQCNSPLRESKPIDRCKGVRCSSISFAQWILTASERCSGRLGRGDCLVSMFLNGRGVRSGSSLIHGRNLRVTPAIRRLHAGQAKSGDQPFRGSRPGPMFFPSLRRAQTASDPQTAEVTVFCNVPWFLDRAQERSENPVLQQIGTWWPDKLSRSSSSVTKNVSAMHHGEESALKQVDQLDDVGHCGSHPAG